MRSVWASDLTRTFRAYSSYGLDQFDEDDLYEALDDLWARQDKIEKAFWCNHLARRETPPAWFLYDVTSSL